MLSNKKIFMVLFLTIGYISLFAHDNENKNHNIENITLSADEKEYLKKKKIIKIMNLGTFPPFNFSKNNQAVGYSIDYMKLMASYLDVKIEFISGKTWNEYLNMLEAGSLDVIPHIAINEERKKSIDFTSFNHIVYSIGLITSKEMNVTSIKEFEGKTIAVTKNTFLHSHLKNNFPKIKLLVTKSSLNALEAVYTNKADAVIGSLPSLNYYVQDNWMNSLKSIKLNDLGLDSDVLLPMGIKKGNKHLKSVLEKANASISIGQVINLKRKWFTSKYVVDIDSLTKEEHAYLDNKKELLMCIDPNWLPIEKNEYGKHIGMSADYIKIFEKRLGIDIKMVATNTWSESIKYGKERRCDIFSMIMKTNERQKFLNFTKPYLEVPLVIATSNKQFFINDINSILDKKVGIVKDFAFVEILKDKYPNINLIEVKSVEEGLEKVKQEELFGFFGALSTVGYTIQKNYAGELKIAGKFEESWKLSIGARNDEPLLVEVFDKVINTLSVKDEQEILNKWISVSYEKLTDYARLYQASAVFLIVLIIVLYKNRTVTNINKKLKQASEQILAQQKMVDKYVLIITTNLDGIIIDVNNAFCKAVEYKKDELIGQKHTILNHPDIDISFFDKLKSVIRNGNTWVGEIKNITKNKKVCWLHSYIEPVYEDGKKIAYKSICENITDKKRIEELSVTDKLTGLYNRFKLDEFLYAQIEEYKRYGNIFSIILLDIDDFKKINDTYGHDIGDKVLQETATILKENVRASDVIGRWGGEEFVIVCKNTQGSNAKILAEHLKDKFEESYFKEINKKTISLGIAEINEEDSINTIFKRADEGLYLAKNSGKNKAILV